MLMLMGLFAQAQPGFNPFAPDRETNIKRSPFRAFLNKFSVMASFGYGRTFYNIPIESGGILENGNEPVLLESANQGAYTSYNGVSNWVTNPVLVSDSVPSSGITIYDADTSGIRYSGSGYSIPVNLSVHFDIERFRVGAGISYEFHGFNSLEPEGGPQLPYKPDFGMTSYRKIYVLLGGQVYYFRGWMYHAEIQVGKVKYGNNYSQDLQNGLYFNLGFPAEYRLSEYFYFFARPSVEFKGYSIDLPVNYGGENSGALNIRQPTFNLSVGFRYKFPEVPRCPVKSCHIQLKHVHGNKEYRGQPFYKEQNPKIGELNENFIHNWQNRKEKMGQ